MCIRDSLRSDDQGKSYKKLASLDAKTLTYKDRDLTADQIYHYVMIAEDDAKNVSDTSAAYYLRSYRASIQPPTGLNYKDGQLTWTNPSSSDTQFLIYNGDSQTSLKKLATVDQPFYKICLLYTSPSPRDRTRSRMPSSACKQKKQPTHSHIHQSKNNYRQPH